MSGYVRVFEDDCRNVLRTIPDNSVDSVITDPPYALVSIVRRFGADNAAPARGGHANGAYQRASAGFMGKRWDTGETAFTAEFWAEVLRVLKPGGHIAVFGGTRTYHRLACAIEDAGFEIRDQLAWTFGQGFPKSHDIGDGWGTALKPAWEPICLARKPLSEKTVAANVLRWGTGAINVDGCRIEATDKTPAPVGQYGGSSIGPNGHKGARNGSQDHLGRFPANLCHDGSQEVLDLFPDNAGGGSATPRGPRRDGSGWDRPCNDTHDASKQAYDGKGSAARFFYCAKASKADRAGSGHPTVKPVRLMQWLARLITPPGGIILDPFAGSGTTGVAASLEGFDAILIEREKEYFADLRQRVGLEV